MKCVFIPEKIHKEWKQYYRMEFSSMTSHATSMAPNGVDVWQSGGISVTISNRHTWAFNRVKIMSKINVIRNETFGIRSSDHRLPIPLAGHCQLFITKGQVFLYGGVTSNASDAKSYRPAIRYSNEAFLWFNNSWSEIPSENPCTNNGQDLAFQQPCTLRKQANDTEVIIVTFTNRKSCTSKLNLYSFNWTMIQMSDIPIGGHLVTSIGNNRVFYLGGLYYKPKETQSLDVFELGSTGWQIIKAKLPFGIASNVTKSYPSQHNVTLH